MVPEYTRGNPVTTNLYSAAGAAAAKTIGGSRTRLNDWLPDGLEVTTYAFAACGMGFKTDFKLGPGSTPASQHADLALWNLVGQDKSMQLPVHRHVLHSDFIID